MNTDAANKPVIALAMGDPAGISPELTAKVAAMDEIRAAAHLVVIGDRRVFDEGARVAGVTPDVEVIAAADPVPGQRERPVFVDLQHLDPASIERAVATRVACRRSFPK